MAQYVGMKTCPDVTASVKRVAAGAHPVTADEFKFVTKTIRHMKCTHRTHRNYARIDITSVRLLFHTNPSLANAREIMSELNCIFC